MVPIITVKKKIIKTVFCKLGRAVNRHYIIFLSIVIEVNVRRGLRILKVRINPSFKLNYVENSSMYDAAIMIKSTMFA